MLEETKPEENIDTEDSKEDVTRDSNSNDAADKISADDRKMQYTKGWKMCKSNKANKKGKPGWQCHICLKVLYSPSGFGSHMTTAHEGRHSYHCPYCGKGHTATTNVKAHLRSKHGLDGFSCMDCGEQMASLRKLEEHLDSCRSDAAVTVTHMETEETFKVYTDN